MWYRNAVLGKIKTHCLSWTYDLNFYLNDRAFTSAKQQDLTPLSRFLFFKLYRQNSIIEELDNLKIFTESSCIETGLSKDDVDVYKYFIDRTEAMEISKDASTLEMVRKSECKLVTKYFDLAHENFDKDDVFTLSSINFFKIEGYVFPSTLKFHLDTITNTKLESTYTDTDLRLAIYENMVDAVNHMKSGNVFKKIKYIKRIEVALLALQYMGHHVNPDIERLIQLCSWVHDNRNNCTSASHYGCVALGAAIEMLEGGILPEFEAPWLEKGSCDLSEAANTEKETHLVTRLKEFLIRHLLIISQGGTPSLPTGIDRFMFELPDFIRNLNRLQSDGCDEFRITGAGQLIEFLKRNSLSIPEEKHRTGRNSVYETTVYPKVEISCGNDKRLIGCIMWYPVGGANKDEITVKLGRAPTFTISHLKHAAAYYLGRSEKSRKTIHVKAEDVFVAKKQFSGNL
jgi:hypothetical protein